MTFKEKTIKVKKTSNFFSNFISVLLILIIFFIWYFILDSISRVDFWIKKLNIINGIWWDEEITKEKINILLTWKWWWDHDAPELTDTIILASINFKYNTISMLSIPRDLYVNYYTSWRWKINELYIEETLETWSKEEWMKALEKKVSEITWEEVDYYINIDFKWFKELIDTFWWVKITLEQNFVDYEYPDWKWWYTTFVLRKWTWNLDWEVALKYVRSRHSTSDFDRSYRQQQVIKSLKDRIVEEGFLKNLSKIKKLYSIFSEYIITDIDLENLLKMSYLHSKIPNMEIISSNINDSCFYWAYSCEKGWFLYVPQREMFNNLSVLLAYWTDITNLDNYEELNKYTNLVFNKPLLFSKKYKINVFNSLKVNSLASLFSDKLKKYWFNIPPINSIWNTKEVYKESIIYYNNIEEDSQTIEALKTIYTWKFEKIDSPKISKDKEVKIEIILWEDYEKVFNL